MKLILIFLLLIINLCLKLKSFRAPLDYDTSSHLYYAFLKNRKVAFLSAYGFGVKNILPNIYAIAWKLLKKDIYRFRILNILSSSFVVILWVLADPFISHAEVPFYFLGVLLINSLWINYLTSASEFHGVVLTMIIFLLPSVLPVYASFILQLILLAILVGAFKIADAAYLLPILVFYNTQIAYHKWWFVFGLLFFGFYIFWGLGGSFSSIKQYATTRKWLNPKSAAFILRNPHFCLLLFLLGLGNIIYAPWQWALLQLTVWVILLVQRYYIGYFFYPSVVLGLFIAFQAQWLDFVPISLSLLLVLVIFLGHTLRDILICSPRQIIIRSRKLCFESWQAYLDKRDLQIQWLKKNLKKEKVVYLWGSEVSLLLSAQLLHSSNTYYSHNHLTYWSDIKSKQDYALSYILKERPEYIIECAIVEGMEFPKDKLNNIYVQIGSVGNMNVYEKNI